MYFPSGFFQKVLLIFVFYNLNAKCRFFVGEPGLFVCLLHLSGLVFFLNLWLDVWHRFGGNSQHYYFKYLFSSFLSFLFWKYHYAYVASFVVIPQSLSTLVFFFFPLFFLLVFQSLFPLLSRFSGCYWEILKLRNSFLNSLQSTNKPIKGILHFCYSVCFFFIFYPVFLYFSLTFSFSDYTTHSLLLDVYFSHWNT